MELSGQLHAPTALTPRKRGPGIHWLGGWVGPRAGLDTVMKEKFTEPRQDSNPDYGEKII